MRVWLDADHAPHVLIMRPLARDLEKQGHEVRFTARDRTATCELLDLYGLPYVTVGRGDSSRMISKAFGIISRAVALVRAMWGWHPDVSYGHGSRALPVASRLMGDPTLTMLDYEWANSTLFNYCCTKILLPHPIQTVPQVQHVP